MKASESVGRLFDPIPSDPLAERAAAQVESLILGGILKDGAKLPGERELAAQLDISRPKVREALRLLEERGLVQIVAGEGAFVASLSGPAMSPALIALYTRHPAALDDHMEYRRHQESFAARLAAERATDSDRADIRRILDEMKEVHLSGDRTRASELDAEFHMRIVEASYNRVLIHTMAALYDLNRRSVFFNRQELLSSPTVGGVLLRQHEDIAHAIFDGAPEAAAQAAANHIDFIRSATADSIAARRRRTVSHKRSVA